MDTNQQQSPLPSQESSLTPSNETQSPARKNILNQYGFVPIIIGIILVILVVGFGAYYLGQRSSKPSQLNNQTQTQSYPSATPIQNDITNWQSYTVKEVGLEFKLPPAYSELGDIRETVVSGQKGTQICFDISKKTSMLIQEAYAGGGCNADYSAALRIGTTSVDYEAGRSGSFTDLQGFEVKNGKYYGKFVGSQTVDLPQSSITKIANDNGIDVLKIKGKFNPDDGPSLMNSLGDDIGILVNTNNSTYPGVAMAFKLTNGVTDETVNQIISTIKFTNQTNDTSGLQTYTNTKYGYSLKYPNALPAYNGLATSKQDELANMETTDSVIFGCSGFGVGVCLPPFTVGKSSLKETQINDIFNLKVGEQTTKNMTYALGGMWNQKSNYTRLTDQTVNGIDFLVLDNPSGYGGSNRVWFVKRTAVTLQINCIYTNQNFLNTCQDIISSFQFTR